MKAKNLFIFIRIAIVSLILSLFLNSCDNQAEVVQVDSVNDSATNTLYGKNLAHLPNLLAPAKEELIHWSVFEDFESNYQKLSDKTIPQLLATTKLMKQQSDSLLKKIPESLNTQPIYTRMLLVDTRIKILEQHLNRARIDSLQIELSLKETSWAMQDLMEQINWTFRKNKIDEALKETEKKELENQRRFLDSVYKSELEDNNLPKP